MIADDIVPQYTEEQKVKNKIFMQLIRTERSLQ
jgi:hypothetical protein